MLRELWLVLCKHAKWRRMRVVTVLRFAISRDLRQTWHEEFHENDSLFSARFNRAQGSMQDVEFFQTLAGFYNDKVTGGHMSRKLARKLYEGDWT